MKFLTLVVMVFASMVFAQHAPIERKNKAVSIETAGTKLDAVQRASIQAQATISFKQVAGVIEVSGKAGGPMVVTFESTKPLDPGSTIAFNVIAPDGTQLPMQGYQIGTNPDGTGWNVYAELWNGTFVNWPTGDTTFGVAVLSGGQLYYTSATISVGISGVLAGPLRRADVSLDGTFVIMTGPLGSDVVATVDSSPVKVTFDPKTGEPRISLIEFGPGDHSLTVCSGGACSTRPLTVVVGPDKG